MVSASPAWPPPNQVPVGMFKLVISDDDIVQAMLFLLERSKVMAEPAGAAAVAALLAGRITFPAGTRIAVVISGGNIDLSRLRTLLPVG